jgi:CubicO group peptidase (beta-lactamase class C family)
MRQFGLYKFALPLALAFAATTLVQAQSTESVAPARLQVIDRIDALAATEFAKESVGSITIGVVVGPKLIWTKSYGYADMDKKLLATPDMVYRIGSITKQFTALMLLQLAQADKLKLSDPVEKYFPEVNRIAGRYPDSPSITLLQLAIHTSGLAREPQDLANYLKGPVADWESVLVSALPNTNYLFAPGNRFAYSNVGYAVLGAALGRAAGEPYVDYVRKNIFNPLGMTHTDFEPNAQITPLLAAGYAKGMFSLDAATPLSEHKGRGYKVPNGAVYSTVGDLAKFISFELGYGPQEVLKKKTLEDNYQRTLSTKHDVASGYGVGFMVENLDNLVVLGHGGAVAGYLSAAYFDRTSETGVVVLRNVSGRNFGVDQLAIKALQILATSQATTTN